MIQKSIQKKESGEEGDLEVLISILPSKIQNYINVHEDKDSLVEVILDLGRPAEVRFFNSQEIINDGDITHVDLQSLISRVGDFGDDNRAGIERTLHRISVIRNRKGAPVGITCRVGRAIEGTIKNIEVEKVFYYLAVPELEKLLCLER